MKLMIRSPNHLVNIIEFKVREMKRKNKQVPFKLHYQCTIIYKAIKGKILQV